jgi:hypothetical protein
LRCHQSLGKVFLSTKKERERERGPRIKKRRRGSNGKEEEEEEGKN